MENIIIWGCGVQGEVAYDRLKDRYNVIGVADNSKEKIGRKCTFAKSLTVLSIDEVKKTNARIFIASRFARDIAEQLLKVGGIESDKIFVYSVNENIESINGYLYNIEDAELEKKYRADVGVINTGKFLKKCYKDNISLDVLSFMSGGSGVLDYAVIKGVMQLLNLKTYLEIGTYIGESISIVSDVARHAYSITVPESHPMHMKYWCESFGMKDWSNKLVNKPNMIQYKVDSSKFDYSSLPEEIDLYFIDGDHSYVGVYNDTKLIFESRKKDSIVIWHDFKRPPNQLRLACMKAVEDVLQNEFDKVYLFDNCLCGIYIPDNYKSFINDCLGNDDNFYSYKLKMEVCIS